jgi:putative transposase
MDLRHLSLYTSTGELFTVIQSIEFECRHVKVLTTASESLNSVIHAATKRRELFPTDESAIKVIYLAINDASKKWTMPIRNWRTALNRFMIEFEARLTDYV